MRRRGTNITGGMRRAFTLIELIFSMMIIAVVFSVVPKIIFVSNQSLSLGLKEEAFFNAMSLMGQVVHLPWDENNAQSDKILVTDSGKFPCSVDYRIGGFVSSRNCIDSNVTASSIAKENEYNDIDDYHNYATTTQVGGNNRFQLDVEVTYADDNYEPITKDATVLLNNTAGGTTNIKRTLVSVTTHSDNKRSNVCSSFFFYSANLGHTFINRRAW